jgi:glycosyltransferase involved in cell wall biosynthesis
MNYRFLDSAKRFEIESQSSVGGHFRRFAEARRNRLLGEAISQWKPDVVVLNSEIDLTAWVSGIVAAPVVPLLHGYMELGKRLGTPKSEGNLYRRLLASPKSLYRRLAVDSDPTSQSPGKCTTAICVSEFVARELSKYWPNVRKVVVYNGVDHSRFFPTWEDQGYALCVSRLVPHKNLEFLVRAFRSSEYPLVVHGKMEPGAQRAKEFLNRLESMKGPQTTILIHESEERMIDLLQRSSIFLHPGKDEGFGLASLEAMACGKVVIGHDSGGTPEVIEGCGFLIGDDESKWLSTADRLMKSMPLRTAMGRKAYEYSKAYSWEKTSAEFEVALESVVLRQR